MSEGIKSLVVDVEQAMQSDKPMIKEKLSKDVSRT
jgi:hypothetical protein